MIKASASRCLKPEAGCLPPHVSPTRMLPAGLLQSAMRTRACTRTYTHSPLERLLLRNFTNDYMSKSGEGQEGKCGMVSGNITSENEWRVGCAEGRMPRWACWPQTLCRGSREVSTESRGQERGGTGGIPAALCLFSAVLLSSGLIKAK